MRLLHGAGRRRAGEILRQGAVDAGRQVGADHRRPRHPRASARAPGGVPRRAGRAMRLLPAGHPNLGQGLARPQRGTDAGGDRRGARRQYLSLRQPYPHPQGGRARRRRDEGRTMSANIPLPPLLETNPRLDQWVKFSAPGKVTVSTGRVEIGQGVLTAMLQIAADELDVAADRIDLQTGDTTLTPNEGYTAGSQSIQFGGIAMRLVFAEIRGLFLAAAASRLNCAAADLSIMDCAVWRDDKATGQDYWSLVTYVDLTRSATASAAVKSANDFRVVGQ